MTIILGNINHFTNVITKLHNLSIQYIFSPTSIKAMTTEGTGHLTVNTVADILATTNPLDQLQNPRDNYKLQYSTSSILMASLCFYELLRGRGNMTSGAQLPEAIYIYIELAITSIGK